jgi:hypothetical protein
MGNVIETVRSTGSEYLFSYVCGEKIKTDGQNNTPEPMSLPINDLPYSRQYKQLHILKSHDILQIILCTN